MPKEETSNGMQTAIASNRSVGFVAVLWRKGAPDMAPDRAVDEGKVLPKKIAEGRPGVKHGGSQGPEKPSGALGQTVGNRALQRLLAQRKTDAGFELNDETASRINQARGGGQPLDTQAQAQLSERLGYDLSGVRVHTGGEADTLNRQLNAKAFTTGSDIFFSAGAYEPHSSGGQELLAHELTHVVQQGSGAAGGSSGNMTVNPPGDRFEQEADAFAKEVVGSINNPRGQRQVSGDEEELKTRASQRGVVPGEEEDEILQRQELDEHEEKTQLQGPKTAGSPGTTSTPVKTPPVEGILSKDRLEVRVGGVLVVTVFVRSGERPRLHTQAVPGDGGQPNQVNIVVFRSKNQIVRVKPLTPAEINALSARYGAWSINVQTDDAPMLPSEIEPEPRMEVCKEVCLPSDREQIRELLETMRTQIERDHIRTLLTYAGEKIMEGKDYAEYGWAMEEAVDVAQETFRRKAGRFGPATARQEILVELVKAAEAVVKLGGGDEAVETAAKLGLAWAENQLEAAIERCLADPTDPGNLWKVAGAGAQVTLFGGDPQKAYELFLKPKEQENRPED